MGLVKEKDHLWLIPVPGLRKSLEELGYHPEHEGGVHGRIVNQSLTVQNLNGSLSVAVRTEPVPDIQGRLPEEELSALRLQSHHGPDNRTEALLRNISIGKGIFLCVLPHRLQHGPQILGINQKQLLIIRYLKNNCQNIRLDIVEAQNPSEQQGPHLGNRGPQSLKDSARTLSVMVLPVPVAPAIIPCRFAILG